jgi:hypothetical protein
MITLMRIEKSLYSILAISPKEFPTAWFGFWHSHWVSPTGKNTHPPPAMITDLSILWKAKEDAENVVQKSEYENLMGVFPGKPLYKTVSNSILSVSESQSSQPHHYACHEAGPRMPDSRILPCCCLLPLEISNRLFLHPELM